MADPPSLSHAKKSAESVAALRYIGSFEHDPAVRNPDPMAGMFLARGVRTALRASPSRALARRMIGRRFPGAIEYQTARTKHFDASLTKALGDGIRQLVILGAGYDTRAYRFHDELGDRQVFEVDHSATIDRKRAFLSHCAETHSTRLEHVAVDFENDDLAAELETAGYTPSCPTLFLWEGVTMFITAEAVHRTLSFVAQRSGPNTRIVFDYVNAAALSDPKPFYGGAQAARHFERSGEPWRYGIDPERPEELVGECGLTLVQHLRAQDLQERYLIDSRGRLRGRVPDFHGIITALARHPVALSR